MMISITSAKANRKYRFVSFAPASKRFPKISTKHFSTPSNNKITAISILSTLMITHHSMKLKEYMSFLKKGILVLEIKLNSSEINNDWVRWLISTFGFGNNVTPMMLL
jgi:hypothetical protein